MNDRSLFRDVAALLCETAPRGLFSDNSKLKIVSQASQMPSILAGGFEIRLSGQMDRVDVQQRLGRGDSAIDSLLEYIEARSSAGGEEVWQRLGAFLKIWHNQKSELHAAIEEIWLEFDIIDGQPTSAPLIFFSLPHNPDQLEVSLTVAKRAIVLLSGENIWQGIQSHLRSCFTSCPAGVFIGYIGLILTREFPCVRVNVKRLNSVNALEYLKTIGWSGNTAIMQSQMLPFIEFCDRITLCLDIGEEITSSLGLELIMEHSDDLSAQWGSLLTSMTTKDLCSSERKTKFMQWPNELRQEEVLDIWPKMLVAGSLAQSKSSCFQTEISHLKLSLDQQDHVSVKGYLWFEHQWVDQGA